MHQHLASYLRHSFIAAAVLLAPVAVWAEQQPAKPQPTAQAPADNTKVNTRDRAKGAITADQQKENAADRAISQKIRKALMAEKSLSTYAKNVKVVTLDGAVTLKGPVRTEEEKKIVETKAIEVAGEGKVTNQISIAPARGAKK